jgi:hypothetical protein
MFEPYHPFATTRILGELNQHSGQIFVKECVAQTIQDNAPQPPSVNQLGYCCGLYAV